MEHAKIGVGIVTYNRPDFYKTAIASVREHLADVVDEIVSYHDGPLPKGYPKDVVAGAKNEGVASAKNWLLAELLSRGCEYIFLMEDDIEIIDRKAVVGYLAAHRITGIPHFNFHNHGDNTQMEPLAYSDMPIVWWPNCVGAWCFYTREALERVGLFDTSFQNAYEHVEHSWRIYKGHIDYGWWPDVLGSEDWIAEQEGALENSSIRDDNGNWQERVVKALDYWRSKDPECPATDPNWDAA